MLKYMFLTKLLNIRNKGSALKNSQSVSVFSILITKNYIPNVKYKRLII